MNSDFWFDRWKTNRIGFHQTEINEALRTWWPKLNIEPNTPILVPLCGKSGDLHWLRKHHQRVTGIELSPIAAQAFFEEANLKVVPKTVKHFEHYEHDGLTILCGNFFEATESTCPNIGGFFDRASVIALPQHLRTRYAATLARICAPGTSGLMITLSYDQHLMEGPPFSVPPESVVDLLGADFTVTLLSEDPITMTNPRMLEANLPTLTRHVLQLIRRG